VDRIAARLLSTRKLGSTAVTITRSRH